jgi:hypothetical protein
MAAPVTAPPIMGPGRSIASQNPTPHKLAAIKTDNIVSVGS